MGELDLIKKYFYTIRSLKPSQVFYRIVRRAGGETPLCARRFLKTNAEDVALSRNFALPELDFDQTFIARFDCNAILEDHLSLLHHEEVVDWHRCWSGGCSTPLWEFNLQYQEYLLALANQFLKTGDSRYLEKAKFIILAWINFSSQRQGGSAWHPYTISMRLVNWVAFYSELEEVLSKDNAFSDAFFASLRQQYYYLVRHLEKDILANHYFENLKALVIGSLLFRDEVVLDISLRAFLGQCDEQILPDGMHYELSPMYHKVILEGLLRVAIALESGGYNITELVPKIQTMIDCLYSLERNTVRTPLFNDSGDNIAKHKDSLMLCAKARLGISPVYRAVFPDAGYYVLEQSYLGQVVKVIFDLGKPGPKYARGHVHGDAMSYECFVDGYPVVVNSGTGGYQIPQRNELRSASAHNVALINDVDQMEHWGEHRVARCFSLKKWFQDQASVTTIIGDMQGQLITRTLTLSGRELRVCDSVETGEVLEYVHFIKRPLVEGEVTCEAASYYPDFGKVEQMYTCKINSTAYVIILPLHAEDQPCLIA